MTRDRKVLYATAVTLLVMLLAALFISNIVNRWLLALFMIPCAIVIFTTIKKRSLLSVHKKEVTIVMLMIGIIYLLIYYLSGLYFGFARNIYGFSSVSIYRYMLPITIIVVSTEIIRYVMIAQKDTKISIITYVACVLIEILLASKLQNVKYFDVFMNLVGITLFPAIISNLLYHYLSKNYGIWPNIAYRLVTILYFYILPIVPKVPEYFVSFVTMLLPIAIFLFIKAMYERKVYAVSYKKQRVSKIFAVIGIVIMAAWVMLISCQFRYGLIVVGSESMTGEINKGDAVFFEEYRDQEIREGQVIIFQKNNMRIIHRVMEIKVIDGEIRYYTKGDANESMDVGYVTKSQIVGVTHFRIIYIGYPTLWLRDIFS